MPGTTVLPCTDGAATSLGSFADLELSPALGQQPGTARVHRPGLCARWTAAGGRYWFQIVVTDEAGNVAQSDESAYLQVTM